MQAGRKNLAHQCIVPYVKGYELSRVHDVIKWVTHSIVHREFRHYKPFGRLIVNNMGVERRGKHVIQLLIDRVGRSSRQQYFYLQPW